MSHSENNGEGSSVGECVDPPMSAQPVNGTAPSHPPPIDTRACFLATQIVEGHYESVTGSHMHWLYRELSKLMHRDFALSAREEASLATSASAGGRGHHHNRHNNKRRHAGGEGGDGAKGGGAGGLGGSGGSGVR